jgi:hypothetical protein
MEVFWVSHKLGSSCVPGKVLGALGWTGHCPYPEVLASWETDAHPGSQEQGSSYRTVNGLGKPRDHRTDTQHSRRSTPSTIESVKPFSGALHQLVPGFQAASDGVLTTKAASSFMWEKSARGTGGEARGYSVPCPSTFSKTSVRCLFSLFLYSSLKPCASVQEHPSACHMALCFSGPHFFFH